jgi:hypothetical protein
MRAAAEADSLIGPHLQAFFAEHLFTHKRVSPQTIACYPVYRRLGFQDVCLDDGMDSHGIPQLTRLDQRPNPLDGLGSGPVKTLASTRQRVILRVRRYPA